MGRFAPGWRGVALLASGMVVGLLASGGRAPSLRAGGGDRPDASIVASVAYAVEMHPQTKSAIAKDAVCVLNYTRGYLYAALPMPLKSAVGSRQLSDWGERDLLKDFAIGRNHDPHFAMTSGGVGAQEGGWSALYIIETTTGQTAVYRIEPEARAGSNAPRITLLERRQDPRLGQAGGGATASR